MRFSTRYKIPSSAREWEKFRLPFVNKSRIGEEWRKGGVLEGGLAGESLARTQVSTVAPGTRVLRCTGYSITSPRCQPCRNRSPHPVRPPDACSPLFIITFPSLSNYRSLCPREGTRKTEGGIHFFPFQILLNHFRICNLEFKKRGKVRGLTTSW